MSARRALLASLVCTAVWAAACRTADPSFPLPHGSSAYRYFRAVSEPF